MTTRLLGSMLLAALRRVRIHRRPVISLVGATVLSVTLGFGTSLAAQPRWEDQALDPTLAGLSPADAAFGRFGSDIAISADANSILIGGPGTQNGYRFLRENGIWGFDEGLAINGQYTPVAVSGSTTITGFGTPGSDAGVIELTAGGDIEFLINGLETPAKAIAMSPGVIAAGMPDHAGGAGRVRVYRFNSQFGIWISDAPLDGGVGDAFGSALAFDSTGDFLVVGAPGAAPNGEVEVFAYVAANWIPWQTIEPEADYDAQSDAGFGSSVAVAGNWLAVGVPEGDRIFTGAGIPAVDGGLVELFEFEFLAYSYRQRFQAGIADDNLGASVGMENLGGGRYLLAAGSPARGTIRAGRVLTYWLESGSTTWSGGQLLEPSNGSQGDEFGTALAVGGGVVAVGGPGWDFCPGGLCTLDLGMVYVYVLVGDLFADAFESGDVLAWE